MHPTFEVHICSHGYLPDSSGVPPVATSSPQGKVTNMEFCQSIHVIAQMATAQAERGETGALSGEATRV